MNNLANDLQNWMKTERGPLSLSALCTRLGPEKVLAFYGIRNAKKTAYRLEKSKLQPLQTNVLSQTKRISEIMRYHLGYLSRQNELQLPENSVFKNRSFFEHTTLPCYMTQCLREEFPLRENALCEARFFALQHLPAQDDGETSVRQVIHELEQMYIQAINHAFSYFDTDDRLEIPALQWLSMQILLARYGFIETVSKWAEQFDGSSTQAELYRQWCSLNTLQGMLMGNPVQKLPETVVFPRIAGMRSRGLSLREYVLNECRQQIHAVLGLDIFPLLTASQLQNIRFQSYMLYFFKEVLAKKYKDASTRPVEPFRAVMNHLHNLFDLDDREHHYALILTSLFVIQCRPALSMSPTLEEFKQLFEVVRVGDWRLPSQDLDRNDISSLRGRSFLLTMLQLLQGYGMSPFNLGLSIDLAALDTDMRFICSRADYDVTGSAVVLRVQEESISQPESVKLSVKEHIHFLATIEEVSRLRFSQDEISHVLKLLPLRRHHSRQYLLASAIETLDDFLELRKIFLHLQDQVHFSIDVVEAIQEWQGSCAQVFPLDPQVFLNMRGRVTELLRYSLCPPTLLIQQYSRFFYMMHQKPLETDDRYQHWIRASLFNGTVVEQSSNSRALCCRGSWNSDKSAFSFSALWVDSLSSLQTRSIQAVLRIAQRDLPQDKDYAQDGEALCQEESIQELEVHPDFRAFCYDVKVKMRKMLLSTIDPIITHQGDCFFVTSPKAELVPSACRVQILECGGQLQECLREFGEMCVVSELFIDERAALHEILVRYTYEREECLGSGEDAEKLLMYDFYTVRFTVKERPEFQYEMRYQQKPTVQLLAWQLALFKHQLLIIA